MGRTGPNESRPSVDPADVPSAWSYNEDMARSRAARKQAESSVDLRAPEVARPQWEPPQGVVVGAAHDPAEHAADALAAQVLAKLGPTHGGPPGVHAPVSAQPPGDDAIRRSATGGMAGQFEADASTSADLRGRTGRGRSLDSPLRLQMERGFGRSLAGVQVHTDDRASRLADSFGADAFTHGHDVFFGRGRYSPDSAAGKRLLVHELAHVVQGGNAVRRKMKGTSAAVEEGQGKAGRAEKLFRTDYAKIVSKLKDYEKREDKVLRQKNFGRMGDDKFWMQRTLRDVLKSIDSWLADNDKFADAGKRTQFQDDMWNVHANEFETAVRDDDDKGRERLETKMKGGKDTQRARRLTMVKPRIAAELQDLDDAGSYFKTQQLDDTKLDRGSDFTKDDAVGGAQNRLDKVQYKDGKKGFFIADKSASLNIAQEGFGSKIDLIDPQIGARSVASARLAKLFGASEIVDVQFAVHSSTTNLKGKPLAQSLNKLGVVSEVAEGTEGSGVKVSRSDKERAHLEGKTDKSKVVDISDPELQRGLNVLQMLDYISLQLDRHLRNFYIATDDKGRVLGIKGIDLDISFGKRGKDGDVEAGKSGHFVGVPQLADMKFRAKILGVTPAEVANCLAGLISPSEVAAAVERFTHLQKVMRTIDPKKIVQEGGWGKETAKQQIGQSNYLNKLNINTVVTEFGDEVDVIIKNIEHDEREAIRDTVRPLVDQGTLTFGQGLAVVKVLTNSFATNAFWQQSRERRDGANSARVDARKAHEKLLEDKQMLGESKSPGDQAKDLDEKIMAADLFTQEKAALAKAVNKEHDAAVEHFVKAISDYAVRRATRQRPRIPNRPPPPVPTKPRQLAGANN
jgi:hypothetical protein